MSLGYYIPLLPIKVALSEVYLRKTRITLKLIDKIINSQKRVLIFYGNLVQLIVIYTHPKEPSLFLTNKIGAPQSDILDQ